MWAVLLGEFLIGTIGGSLQSPPLSAVELLFGLPVFVASLYVLNFMSYNVLKKRILKRRVWDLNVCCGKTDGGGINADIVQHADVPNFVQIDIYNHPFADKQFDHVLCSHTIEHVEDPRAFFEELQRVGKHVTLVVPPLWDLSAVFNILEHRWIFLTFRKEHNALPMFIALPFAERIQKRFGQRIHA